MRPLIFIADYGTDPLAVTEAIIAVRQYARAAFSVDVVASRPFNTVHTGFLLDQLQRGFGKDGARAVFYLNTDPRTQTTEATVAAAGSPLVAAQLQNGAWVITPNAGHCLSFVRGTIARLATIHVAADGSQFRSRDVFPLAVAAALDGTLPSLFGSDLPHSTIPPLPDDPIVLHCDNYGNIKTSLTQRILSTLGCSWGDEVRVRIGGHEFRVPMLPTIFSDRPGRMVLAPGSSGDPAHPYFEISVRFNGDAAASAAAKFGWPEPGTPVACAKA
ncbi:SAM-dependent chlorinase/fluorinase [Candidatus Uhrbacteria bacterium]|nr:SAM-dependent chlorinase/fluorinase [Candidatus Uhrbacteria bacterium]